MTRAFATLYMVLILVGSPVQAVFADLLQIDHSGKCHMHDMQQSASHSNCMKQSSDEDRCNCCDCVNHCVNGGHTSTMILFTAPVLEVLHSSQASDNVAQSFLDYIPPTDSRPPIYS